MATDIHIHIQEEKDGTFSTRFEGKGLGATALEVAIGIKIRKAYQAVLTEVTQPGTGEHKTFQKLTTTRTEKSGP